MFTNEMYPDDICRKYDDFLFHKNYPLKGIIGLLNESIQSVSIPGIGLNNITVQGLENTGKNPRSVKDKNGKPDFPHTTINRTYPGTSPINEVVEGNVVTITFRNYIINWMYFFEVYWKYYKRSREISMFSIVLTMMDSGEVDIIRFSLGDCYLSTLPNLIFAYNKQFNESENFDAGFIFNKYDVDFIAPTFDLNRITLKKNL
jgi:hypothetical protein